MDPRIPQLSARPTAGDGGAFLPTAAAAAILSIAGYGMRHSPADRSSIDKNINAREAARERNLWCWHHHKGRMLFCGGRDGCNFANGPLAGC